LQHRFAEDDLFKHPGIKIPGNPARAKSANYSFPAGRHRESISNEQQANVSLPAALLTAAQTPNLPAGRWLLQVSGQQETDPAQGQ